jgi:hypothetical protein
MARWICILIEKTFTAPFKKRITAEQRGRREGT